MLSEAKSRYAGKKNPMALANAAGMTTAIVYVVCRGAFIVAPDLSLAIARSWFHGIDIGKIAAVNLSSESFVLGIVSTVISAWLVGYLFATTYNMFLKGKK